MSENCVMLGVERGANKITAANAGGPRWLPVRTRWAARVAQFCRYLLDTRSVEMDREMGAFNARFVLGADDVTKVPSGGGAVSLVKTTNGFRPAAIQLPDSWTGLGGKALATIAVLGLILALRSFILRGQSS